MHADTQNTYINTQYRYAWKRSDTRETRMRTNHVTSRACQVLMRIRAAPITRATTTKRTRAFFVSIFRSLWSFSLTYRDLTNAEKRVYRIPTRRKNIYISPSPCSRDLRLRYENKNYSYIREILSKKATRFVLHGERAIRGHVSADRRIANQCAFCAVRNMK